MAFGYDGSIRINTKLDHKGFTKGIDALGNSLKKLAGWVGVAFGVSAIVNFSKESIKAASDLSNAWLGLQSIVEGQGRSFKKAKSFINDYISDGLVPLENAVTAYKNLAARGYSTEQIEQLMAALKNSASFGRQSSYTLGEAIQTATEGLKNENSILVDNAGVTKNVSVMWKEYAKSINVGVNSLTLAQKRQAEVNGILEETKFQTGDAAKLTNTYSGQLAMLSFNFQQLKVAVGNALIPIARAVLPGINAVISALVKLANVFAQVSSLLFGKSMKGVADTEQEIVSSGNAAADATDNLAGATSGAGDAAEKAGKQIRGIFADFDDLTVLADNAADSMSGAAGGLDLSDMDTELPEIDAEGEIFEGVEGSISSLGELFTKTIEDILKKIPDFQESLHGFAEGFNDYNKTVYEAFTFPGLSEKVRDLGTEISDSFNGLVEVMDWELWGRRIGSGFDLGLGFLVSAIYEFDWINLGKKLAEFINGLVYEVNWYDFGKLLWSKFKIALETLAGFILGLDMPELAKAASNIIIGFFDSMQETIEIIDWEGIGRQIAEFLNNIDWVGVITSIADAVKEMVSAGIGLVKGFIENADPDTLLIAAAFLASKFLGGVIKTVVLPIAQKIGQELIEKIAQAISSSEIGALVSSIGTAISGIAKTLSGVASVIAGVMIAATNFFDMWNEGFSLAKEAVMLLGIGLAAVGAVILGAPAVVTAVIAGIVAAVATAAVVVKEHWEDIKTFFSDLCEKIGEFASDAVENVKNFFEGLPAWFSENVIEPAKNFFLQMFENIRQTASDALEKIKETWQVVSGWFDENIIQPVGKFFSDMWNDIKTTATETWQNVKNAWNAAGSWFSQNITGPIGKFFSDTWSNVTKSASDAWANIKKGVQDFWDDVKEWWNINVAKFFSFDYWKDLGKNMIDGLLGGLNDIFSGLSKWASDIWNDITGVFSKNNAKSSISNSAQNRSKSVSYSGREAAIARVSAYTATNLPRLANGAVIPPNQQFAAILGDQTKGYNIEAPADLIAQKVAEGIQAAGGMGGSIGPITINLVANGKTLAKAVVPAINSMTRANGRPVLLT